MKIKLKVEPNWEIWIYESYSTVPIIINGTMIFGAYNVEFQMTDNIWYQLPEEYKKKIYRYNWKKFIKIVIKIKKLKVFCLVVIFHIHQCLFIFNI